MARRSSSGRWSRPASGKQIAALKSHGNYDGKYYSVGRASQAIGRSMASGSGATRASSSAEYPSSISSSYGASSFLAQLMGVNDNMDSLLAAALGQSSLRTDSQFGELPVESVDFTLSPDESHPDGPRIVFEAAIVRDSEFTGNPSLGVRFVSNVALGEGTTEAPRGLSSGVQFEN